jgi:LytR cell envelope-related transcriptional attenuator
MSTDLPPQSPSGRGAPPRRAAAPRSGASAVAIVVALVAAVLGFFILKKIDSKTPSTAATGTVNGQPNNPAGTTTVPTGTTTPPAVTVPAVSTLPRKPITVVVANGSGVVGAAGKYTKSLGALGYTTLPAATATGKKALTTTQIYVKPGEDASAAQVMSDLGLHGIAATPIPTDATKIPVLASLRQGATVVVVLGTDLASAAPPSTPTVPATVTKQVAISAAGGKNTTAPPSTSGA